MFRALKANPNLGGKAIADLYKKDITDNQGVIVTMKVTTEAPTTSSGPTDSSPSPSPSASPAPSSTASPERTGSNSAIVTHQESEGLSTWWWALPIGMVVVGGAGIVAFARHRKNRPLRDPITPPVIKPVSLTRESTKNLPPPPGPPATWNTTPPAGAQASQAPTLNLDDDDSGWSLPFFGRRRRKQNPQL